MSSPPLVKKKLLPVELVSRRLYADDAEKHSAPKCNQISQNNMGFLNSTVMDGQTFFNIEIYSHV